MSRPSHIAGIVRIAVCACAPPCTVVIGQVATGLVIVGCGHPYCVQMVASVPIGHCPIERYEFGFFENGTKTLIKEIEETPFPDHYELFNLYRNLYFHPLHNRFSPTNDCLEKMLDRLDQYFVLSKLRYVSLLKSNQKLIEKPYDFKFIDALSDQQSKFYVVEPRLFEIYQCLSDLLNDKKDVDFKTYEKLFFELVHCISDEDIKILFSVGLDFINRQVNTGKDAYSKCGLKWYKYGLNNGLLEVNSKMDPVIFHTIVEYGCRENELEWANLFISTYRSYLEPDQEEEIVNKSLALIYISNNKFDKALSILNHYTIHDIGQPKTRFHIIRSLFELFLINNDYYNLLLAKIHAFEVFISRNTFFNENVLTSYLNAIRLIRGLANRIVKKESKSKIKNWFVRHTDSEIDIVSLKWLSDKVKAY